jgi:rhodanese-related sulfurtransferase
MLILSESELFPSLADLLDLRQPHEFEGRDLRQALKLPTPELLIDFQLFFH